MPKLERRSFLLGALAGAVATYDLERLLWVPGRKLISLPRSESFYVGSDVDLKLQSGEVLDVMAWSFRRPPLEEPPGAVCRLKVLQTHLSGIVLVEPTREPANRRQAFSRFLTVTEIRQHSEGLNPLPNRYRRAI